VVVPISSSFQFSTFPFSFIVFHTIPQTDISVLCKLIWALYFYAYYAARLL